MNYFNSAHSSEQERRENRYGDDDLLTAKQQLLIDKIYFLTEAQVDRLSSELQKMLPNESSEVAQCRKTNYSPFQLLIKLY